MTNRKKALDAVHFTSPTTGTTFSVRSMDDGSVNVYAHAADDSQHALTLSNVHGAATMSVRPFLAPLRGGRKVYENVVASLADAPLEVRIYDNDRITVTLPGRWAATWATSPRRDKDGIFTSIYILEPLPAQRPAA